MLRRSLPKSGSKMELICRLAGRVWSPSLWASWSGGACGVPLDNDGVNGEEVVRKLAEEYEEDSATREGLD